VPEVSAGDDDFIANRHADLDAGELGSGMTDADYYDRISASAVADDPVSAELAAIREDLARSQPWAFRKADNARHDDLILDQHAPRLLAAVEAVLKLTDGWLANAEAVPVLSREAAGTIIRAAIERELTRKDGTQ
jgi:hypothetical protein